MGGSVCGENGLCSIKTLIMSEKENIESSMDEHKIKCLVEGDDLNNETVDYYKHSKNVWEYLNNIREYPKKYANILLSSLKKYEKERNNLKLENDKPDSNRLDASKNIKSNDNTNINDNSPKNNINLVTYMTNYLLNHEDMLTIIKELAIKLERFQPENQIINNKTNENHLNINSDMNNNNLFSSNIENNEVLSSLPFIVNYEVQYQKYKNPREWSKNLYDAIDNAAKKIYDNSSNNEFDEKNNEEFSPQIILSTALQQRVKIIEYEVSNYATPEIIVWRLLIQNREKICDILYDDYFSGLSYSYVDKEENNNEKNDELEFFKTKFYFIYKLKEEDIVISGLNPFSGLYLPLKLTEPIFKDINFKNEIVGGNYVYNENGITAVFELYNGEHKEENIEFHENNLLGF